MAIQFDEQQTNQATSDLRAHQEEALLQESAEQIGMLYVNLESVGIQTDALRILKEDTARTNNIAVWKRIGREIHIAVKSPENPETKEIIEKLQKKYQTQIYLVSQRSLEKAWSRYQDIKLTEKSAHSLVDISQEALETITQRVQSNEDIRKLFFEAQAEKKEKVTKIIEVILGSAIATKSSDIHIEPQDDKVRLRYRQDGVLQDIAFFDAELYKLIVSRIKILSKMKLTNVRDAQDGRFTIEYNDTDIEVRVSTIPSAYGEGIVMRILNPEGLTVGFDELGINDKLLAVLKNEIVKPNGMILTTGPTGSGKTTTLYSFLKYIYTPEINILTIEDPIEYHLEGINQTQVEHERGYDFLSGLRAALRQDPDVIMVGEIRDNETAEIAVNASLTGHLVLSTLHTNNAAGTIPRLLDLGVNEKVLGNALSVSLAQRLVRKLCTHCKQPYKPQPAEQEIILQTLQNAERLGKEVGSYDESNITLYTAPGCPECSGLGYKGRIGVFEAILMDEDIETVLTKKPSERDIWHAATSQKLLTMAEDGIIKALQGMTSFEEVQKVVDLEGYLQIFSHTPDVIPGHTNESGASQESQNTGNDLVALKKREVIMILEYLKVLEEHQAKYPEVGVAEKIYIARKSLLDIMQSMPTSNLFATIHNDQGHHTELETLTHKLSNLEESQRINPKKTAEHDIRNVRETLEHMTWD